MSRPPPEDFAGPVFWLPDEHEQGAGVDDGPVIDTEQFHAQAHLPPSVGARGDNVDREDWVADAMQSEDGRYIRPSWRLRFDE